MVKKQTNKTVPYVNGNAGYLVKVDITHRIQFKVTFLFQEGSVQDVFLNGGARNIWSHVLDSAIRL